jgi:hypothetical protein
MVFQALHYLGRDAITQEVINRLRGALSSKQLRELRADARYATEWIGAAVAKIAGPPAPEARHG